MKYQYDEDLRYHSDVKDKFGYANISKFPKDFDFAGRRWRRRRGYCQFGCCSDIHRFQRAIIDRFERIYDGKWLIHDFGQLHGHRGAEHDAI